MNKKILILTSVMSMIICLGGFNTKSEKVSWLKKNMIPVRTIDPSDTDFSDLKPFKKIIGNAKVVMLGEQSHGDGATFHAKIRLIKFLHEKCGFDVLAFESGIYSCQKSWDQVLKGKNVIYSIKSSIIPIWSFSLQFEPLLKYFKERSKHKRKLVLAGFDCQFTGPNSWHFFVKDLEQYLKESRFSPKSSNNWVNFKEIMQKLVNYDYLDKYPDLSKRNTFLEMLDNIIDFVSKRRSKLAKFWHQVLLSTKYEARSSFQLAGFDRKKLPMKDRECRDISMGENIVWLVNEWYPQKKIIVWAASRHNAYNLRKVSFNNKYDYYVNMGDILKEKLGDKVYNLGFTSYEGKYGYIYRKKDLQLEIPSTGSIEDLFHQTGIELGIVDFKNIPEGGNWLNENIIARPLGYYEMKAKWPEIFDGMMYMKTMYPSDRVKSKKKKK